MGALGAGCTLGWLLGASLRPSTGLGPTSEGGRLVQRGGHSFGVTQPWVQILTVLGCALGRRGHEKVAHHTLLVTFDPVISLLGVCPTVAPACM